VSVFIEVSDHDLVESFRNGSELAWSTLLARYSPLVHAAARSYARTCHSSDACESSEDTASGLYLCMIERLRESILYYYRGECRLRTWVYRLVGDRRQIIKAFLMQTDQGRGRADTRLPRVIQKRPVLDQEVYRRLVWGKDPSWIAWDLGLSEMEAHELASDILALLRKRSPRVYRRIMANRQALRPTVSLDQPTMSSDGEAIHFEVQDMAPLPDVAAERHCLEEHLPQIEHLIEYALADMPEEDVRLMILVFDYGWSLAEVVERAPLMNLEGISARHQVDYRITRSVRAVAARVCENLSSGAGGNVAGECCEEVVASLKVLFRERGILPYLPSGVRSSASSEGGISASAGR